MTANISLEQLKTPEIETPEELIKKLEENSKKTLAEKLKGILASINGTTEEKWQKLKAELSADEEKEIRETFSNKETKIETILNEWIIPTNLSEAKAIAWTIATKEGAEKIIEEGKESIFWKIKSMFEKIFEWLWSLPIIWDLLKMMWFWKKAEEVKEAISQVDKDKVGSEIKKVISDSKIPVEQVKLDETIKNMSETDMKTLSEKIKKWEKISIEDLKNLESTKILFSKNNVKAWVKEQVEKWRINLVNELKKQIEEKYQIQLSPEKIKKLEIMVKNDLKINDATLEIISKANTEKKISLWEILKARKDNGIDTAWFAIKLVTSGIIPPSAIWLDFAKSWADLVRSAVELSVWALWIKEQVNIDTFNKSIEKLNPDEKALLLALLYRKWWLFLSLIWNIWAFASRLAIEWVTNTSVKTLDTYKAWLKNDFASQAKQFEKIQTSLGWLKETEKTKQIITSALENIKHIEQNYLILDVLKKNWDNLANTIKELNNHGIKIDTKISNMSELKSVLNQRFDRTFTEMISAWNMLNNFGFWAKADLYELNSKLERISKYQKAVFNWNIVWKAWYKRWEVLNIPQVSRMWDRLAFHFNSKQEVKDFWKRMSIIAQESPDLIKWIFDKLPIFVVAWIAASSDKPFFEEIQKEFVYLLPIVWPVLLLWKSWLDWNDWFKVDNALEAWIWWALLAIDWVFLTKELATNWLKWAWRYLVKPISDLYSIWRWTAKFWYEAYKLAEAWKSSEIFKNAIEKTKSLKWKTRAIVLAWLIVWWWVTYAFAWDKNESKNYLAKDWSIDMEKLKKDASKLNKEEKADVVKLFTTIEIGEKFTENIEFRVDWNSIIIDSRNKSVQSNFIINPEIKEKLSILWISNIKFNYYW